MGNRGLLNNRGFSLIELVIVMVIVGILALVAVPKYIDLTVEAEESSTTYELQAIYRAYYIYEVTHNERPTSFNQFIYIPNIENKYELNINPGGTI